MVDVTCKEHMCAARRMPSAVAAVLFWSACVMACPSRIMADSLPAPSNPCRPPMATERWPLDHATANCITRWVQQQQHGVIMGIGSTSSGSHSGGSSSSKSSSRKVW